MSVFQQLLRIREFREQRAQAVVVAERVALQRAADARDAASTELDDFKDYAKARETRLFDDLQARAVQVRDIQDVRYEVGQMKAQERAYAQALDQAEAKRVKQSEVLVTARARHVEADRALQKIGEQVKVDHKEAGRSREQAEEAEREDGVKTNQPDRGAHDDAERRDE